MRMLLGSLLLGALFACPLPAMEKGDESPNFTFESSWNTLEGAKQLTDYRGKVVLLEIWKIQ